MQPLQYDLRDPAARDITHAAKARSNLDAAIPMRSAETELQNTRELRAMASEIVAPKTGSRRQSEKKTILKHFLKGFFEGKSLAPKWRKSANKSLSQPSCTRRTAEVDHRGSGTDFVWKNIGFPASAISQKRISCETSSKTPLATHPPAPLATPFTMREQVLQLQITMEYRFENDPRMIRPHPRPSRTRRTAEVDHRGSGTDFVWKNIGVSCICYLSKTHFVRDFLQNSIGNSSTSTTCNPIYNAGTILQLQITMEYRFENDPRMIRGWSDHTRDRLAPVAPQR